MLSIMDKLFQNFYTPVIHIWILFFCIQYTVLIVSGSDSISTQITQTPELACVGDRVDVRCDLQVLDAALVGKIIIDDSALFIVGDSMDMVGLSDLGSDSVIGGINLTRLSGELDPSSSTSRVIVTISLLNYTNSDSDFLLGCIQFAFQIGQTNPIQLSAVTNIDYRIAPAAVMNATSVIEELNSTTCMSTVNVSWIDPPSTPDSLPTSHVIYLDGIEVNRIDFPASFVQERMMLFLDTSYNYSVSAINCNGTSSLVRADASRISSHSINSSFIGINYDQFNNKAIIEWVNSMEMNLAPLLLNYSLIVNYTYTQDGFTESFDEDSTLSLLSNVTTHTIQLTPHNFSMNSGVSIEIILSLSIAHQCGQSVEGIAVPGSLNTGILIQQIPEYVCPGDRVDIICNFTVINASIYTFSDDQFTFFIVGEPDDNFIFVPEALLGLNISLSNGINLQRLSGTSDEVSMTEFMGNLSLLNSTRSDSGLVLGCHRMYVINGSMEDIELSAAVNVQYTVTPDVVMSANSSITVLNSTTCMSTVNVSWLDPPSMLDAAATSHVIYLNGSEVNRIDVPASTVQDRRILLLDTNHTYSVSAANCNGTSSQVTTDALRISSYRIESLVIRINYNQINNEAIIEWVNSVEMNLAPLLLNYSLKVNYTYTRDSITQSFYDDSTLSLLPNVEAHTIELTPHSFSTDSGVSIEIILSLKIVQQCGQLVDGSVVLGSLNTGVQIQQFPEYACPGDRVDIICDFTVPNASIYTFNGNQDLFIVGNQENLVLQTMIGSDQESDGINLRRLSGTSNSVSLSEFMGNISLLNFTSSDSGLLLGCTRNYTEAGSMEVRILSAAVNVHSLVAPAAVMSATSVIEELKSKTCMSTVNVSWIDPPSLSDSLPTSHVIYLDGIEVNRIDFPAYFVQERMMLFLDRNYKYSVSAINCNGTSSQVTADALRISNHSINSSFIRINYNQLNNEAIIEWENSMVMNPVPLLIDYSLKVNYTYTRDSITQSFYDDSTLSLLSNVETHTIQLTPHGYSTNSGVSIEIILSLSIAQQCGQSVDGIVVPGSLNTGILIQQFPEYACPGDRVDIICNFTVPNASIYTFNGNQDLFIVGNQENLVLQTMIGSDQESGGINLRRLSGTSNLVSQTQFLGNLSILNFTASYSGLLLGCTRNYTGTGSMEARRLSAAVNIISIGSPLTPTSSSISSSAINSSTCVGAVTVRWIAVLSNPPNSHILYQNGIEIATINYPLTSYTHTTTLLLNTDYSYSVAATNCNGTSPQSQSALTLPSIMSYNVTSNTVSISYNQTTNIVDLYWNLTQNSLQILLIEYYVQINYTYTQGGVTEFYYNESILMLFPNVTSYSVLLTNHNFPTSIDLSTEISVDLEIMRQCGQLISQRTIMGAFTVSIPGPGTVESNSAIIGSVLGVLGFFILFFVVILIIIVALAIYKCYTMKTGKDSIQATVKKVTDIEMKQSGDAVDGESSVKNPSIPETIYSNPQKK